MPEVVCPNTFCTFGPKLGTIIQRRGGGGWEVYTFEKLFSLAVQKFH